MFSSSNRKLSGTTVNSVPNLMCDHSVISELVSTTACTSAAAS